MLFSTNELIVLLESVYMLKTGQPASPWYHCEQRLMWMGEGTRMANIYVYAYIYIFHVLSEIILIPGTGKNTSLIHLLCQSCDMLHNVFAKCYHFMPLKCRFRFHLHTIKFSSWWFLVYSRGYAFITTS